MQRRVSWKKGMRLTDEILTLSDECTQQTIERVINLSAAGEFGLIPSDHPFRLSIDISKTAISVVEIDCVGVTRNGSLIDVSYDSRYTNVFDTNTFIPENKEDKVFLLCIENSDVWRDMVDNLCTRLCSFTLIEEFSPVPDNALPIARLVFDENCWRTDEVDFVPPCLFISSSSRLIEEYHRFCNIIDRLNELLPQRFITESRDALKIFWPFILRQRIEMRMGFNLMTPTSLLSEIQKSVSAFISACHLDDYISLGEPEAYLNFINVPYDYRNVYRKIREGINLCHEIQVKVEGFDNVAPTHNAKEIACPFIEQGQLRQVIKFGSVRVKITNREPGAKVYYSVDGTTPSASSLCGTEVIIPSGFQEDWHKEPPKVVTIKVVAIKEGISSKVESFEVVLSKDPYAILEI